MAEAPSESRVQPDGRVEVGQGPGILLHPERSHPPVGAGYRVAALLGEDVAKMTRLAME